MKQSKRHTPGILCRYQWHDFSTTWPCRFRLLFDIPCQLHGSYHQLIDDSLHSTAAFFWMHLGSASFLCLAWKKWLQYTPHWYNSCFLLWISKLCNRCQCNRCQINERSCGEGRSITPFLCSIWITKSTIIHFSSMSHSWNRHLKMTVGIHENWRDHNQ